MEALLSLLPWLGLSYLIGSIPTGVLLGKFHGKDPREHGSGNIGASNVARVLGRKAAFVTVFIDISKGVVLPLLCTLFDCDQTTVLCSGFASIIGHCFPIWLRFKGGKESPRRWGRCSLSNLSSPSSRSWFGSLSCTSRAYQPSPASWLPLCLWHRLNLSQRPLPCTATPWPSRW